MKLAAILVAIVIVTFLYGTLAGWAVHWTLHQRWAGRLHRSHMKHHLELYPPEDLESDTYRDAGVDSGLFVFAPAITVAVLGLVAAVWAVGLPWWMCAVVAGEALLIGVAHNYVHDAMHIRNHWMQFFGRWWWHVRKLHRTHHRHMRRNLGILWFGWDHLFGTIRQKID